MHRIAKSLSATLLPVAFLITLSPAYRQNLSAEITDRAKAAIAKEVRHEARYTALLRGVRQSGFSRG